MDALKQYLFPFLISNLLCGRCVLASLIKPLLARIFLALVFLWAGWVNSGYAIRNPAIYLEYKDLTPLPVYREFIKGFFALHTRMIVIMIAFFQFMIFIGMLTKNGWFRLACLGGIIFGIAIAPLGIGSAFPATLLMAWAFYILFRKYGHDYIWKPKQYLMPVMHDPDK